MRRYGVVDALLVPRPLATAVALVTSVLAVNAFLLATAVSACPSHLASCPPPSVYCTGRRRVTACSQNCTSSPDFSAGDTVASDLLLLLSCCLVFDIPGLHTSSCLNGGAHLHGKQRLPTDVVTKQRRLHIAMLSSGRRIRPRLCTPSLPARPLRSARSRAVRSRRRRRCLRRHH